MKNFSLSLYRFFYPYPMKQRQIYTVWGIFSFFVLSYFYLRLIIFSTYTLQSFLNLKEEFSVSVVTNMFSGMAQFIWMFIIILCTHILFYSKKYFEKKGYIKDHLSIAFSLVLIWASSHSNFFGSHNIENGLKKGYSPEFASVVPTKDLKPYKVELLKSEYNPFQRTGKTFEKQASNQPKPVKQEPTPKMNAIAVSNDNEDSPKRWKPIPEFNRYYYIKKKVRIDDYIQLVYEADLKQRLRYERLKEEFDQEIIQAFNQDLLNSLPNEILEIANTKIHRDVNLSKQKEEKKVEIITEGVRERIPASSPKYYVNKRTTKKKVIKKTIVKTIVKKVEKIDKEAFEKGEKYRDLASLYHLNGNCEKASDYLQKAIVDFESSGLYHSEIREADNQLLKSYTCP